MVGKRGLENGEVELKKRATGQKQVVKLDQIQDLFGSACCQAGVAVDVEKLAALAD